LGGDGTEIVICKTIVDRKLKVLGKGHTVHSYAEDVSPLKRRLGLPSRVPDWTPTTVRETINIKDIYFARDGADCFHGTLRF
jgi:hypothetical protein